MLQRSTFYHFGMLYNSKKELHHSHNGTDISFITAKDCFEDLQFYSEMKFLSIARIIILHGFGHKLF